MKRGALISTRRTLRIVFFLATLVTIPGTSADETRVIQLKHRSAADIIPTLQPLLGPEDAISGMDYRLIVRTSEKKFRELEQVLTRIDTARRQWRISVKQAGVSDSDRSHVGVSGEIGNDQARIRLPRSPGPGNGVVIRRNGVNLEAQQTRTTTQNNITQFITALDGAHAFVRVGQSVPHIQRILILTGNQAILSQGVTYQDIVTGFDVMTQAQGGNVLLTIAPRLSSLQNPATGLVNFQQYATTVVVRPGEWVDLGGLSGQGHDVRREILGSAGGQTSEQRTILIKVD